MSMVLNTLPEVFGLSSHLNLTDKSPPEDPLTIIFLPSLENFAFTPGDVDSIFNEEFSSNPLVASSSKPIAFPPLSTLNPKFLGLSKLYETGISKEVFGFDSFIFGC